MYKVASHVNPVSNNFAVMLNSFDSYIHHWLFSPITSSRWVISVVALQSPPNCYLLLITSCLLSMLLHTSLSINTRKTTVTSRENIFSQIEISHGRYEQVILGIKWQQGCISRSGRDMQKYFHCWHPFHHDQP